MKDRDPVPGQAGVSLIELITVVGIAAILVSVAVPSFRYFTTTNRIAGEINGLVGDLQFARQEAIKEGQTVTVCVSANGKDCASTSTSWDEGWIVFSDPGGDGDAATGVTALRTQKPFTNLGSADKFTAETDTSAVSFNREGFALSLGSAVTLKLQDSTQTATYDRCLTVSVVGMLATTTSSTGCT